ncbi:MerR family transcriptional regulator [Microbacterium sp. bgisy203]|uniref:MerR family transcriptional regulator n=1 Tax=Microbacterium sp. bgisy203 TaxID=3413799 RepID=UPI003D760707
MLSIGEFARLVGVSQRMLRHYDGLGLLVPERVDEYSGYRYYSTAQLDRANRLVALKDLGFRLEEVGEMLDEDASSPRIAGLLRGRRAELREQIDADVRRMRHVEARLRTIERNDPMTTTETSTEFTATKLPRLELAQLSARVGDMAEIEQEIGPMFDRVVGALMEAGVALPSPGVAHYTVDGDQMIAAAAEQVAPSAVPDGLDAAVLDAVPQALTLRLEADDLAGIQAAWQSLVSEVERRGLRPVGTCREVYHETPQDGGRWIVDLQQPVA